MKFQHRLKTDGVDVTCTELFYLTFVYLLPPFLYRLSKLDMENSPTDPRPFKRAKLESDQMDDVQGNTSTMASGVSENDAQTASGKASLVSDDAAKEVQVGITVFVDDSKCTFRGILKKRYTDFLVNEILPDGSVLHLQTTKANNGTASADLAGPSSAIRGGTEQAGTSLKGSGPKAETSDISPPKKEEPEVPTEDSAAQDNSTEVSCGVTPGGVHC